MRLTRRRTRDSDKPRRLKRREAYRQVAELLGGELHEGKRSSQDRVLVQRGPWRVWLDTYTVHTGQATVTYTRVRAYFRGWRELRVIVRRRNWLDRLLARLGFGKRLPVDPRLNEHHVIKGRPERRILPLFSAQGLAAAVLSLPAGRLDVKRPSRKSRKRFGEDAGVVVLETTGVVTDVERLVAMVGAVGEMLDALERFGEARRESLPES
jgi:hypothetical protein